MQQLTQQQQVHYFCDNSDLPATPEHIGILLSTLGVVGLIPNTGNELHAQTGIQNKYIIMVSTTEKFQVQFPNQEVVFLGQDMSNQEFMTKVREVLELLAVQFPNKLSNRLSVLSTEVLQGTIEEYQATHNTLFNGTEEPFEWDYRKAFRFELPCGEKTNSISSIKRCEVQIASKFVDSLMYEVDCNTIFQNSNHRFSFQNASEVLDELAQEAQSIMVQSRAKV